MVHFLEVHRLQWLVVWTHHGHHALLLGEEHKRWAPVLDCLFVSEVVPLERQHTGRLSVE